MLVRAPRPGRSGCAKSTRRLLFAALAGLAAVLLTPLPASADRNPRRSTIDGHTAGTARGPTFPRIVVGRPSESQHGPDRPGPTPSACPFMPGHRTVARPTPRPGKPPSARPRACAQREAPARGPSSCAPPAAGRAASAGPAPSTMPARSDRRVATSPEPTAADSPTSEAGGPPGKRARIGPPPGTIAPAREPIIATATAEPASPATPERTPEPTATTPPQPSPARGNATSDRVVDAQTELGEEFNRSMVYSGAVALGLALIGMAMVAWRRRFW
jgi:hypothetical protein